MLNPDETVESIEGTEAGGEFLTVDGERWYKISRVDRMAPFFISVVSHSNHWLFVSSTGGLTAGRGSPEAALFPYIAVDKIHESGLQTGPRTLIRMAGSDGGRLWEPFNREHDGRFALERNLYKNVAANKLRFEEINHDLELVFHYTWTTSTAYGFARRCELQNFGDRPVRVELLDGLQNVLPAGTPVETQNKASNLVDAYKWTELDADTGLGLFTLYSGISDRAEPAESLRANTVCCLGLDARHTLISSLQLNAFRRGQPLSDEVHKRGIRGAYLVNAELELPAGSSRQWQFLADVDQDQGQVVALRKQLQRTDALAAAIAESIDAGTDALLRIMASADGLQVTAEENVTAHHYANVLFNVLRGGVFLDQYFVPKADLCGSVKHFNRAVHTRNRSFLDALPARQDARSLMSAVQTRGDFQLTRLCLEYLPVTFGRRHGDPSRPWNQFSIRLSDRDGNPLLSYEGNWRDIFQNWEALAWSFPEFTENFIARFVNASTMDGYNPYRLNKQGIDWEVEDPDDPWSYIGYWGDHQLIYLQKLLEISENFHPNRLAGLLRRPLFCYANVPYRIKPFDNLLENPKSTVEFDFDLAARIDERVEEIGADGKLLLDNDGEVYRVNLIEKLLVPLLAKLGNLVVDGGIWLNTQRPEWNDANNALVGQGLSMVTLYYMRRYVCLLQRLLAEETDVIEITADVKRWLGSTAAALREICSQLDENPVTAGQRYESMRKLGEAAASYRESIYRTEFFGDRDMQPVEPIVSLLGDALTAIEHSIGTNRRNDRLFHTYNLLNLGDREASVDTLYPMLEGQVAALSSGAITPHEACETLEALFDSDVYRANQHSFMLYPDRELPGFLQRNRIPESDATGIPLLRRMLDESDGRIVYRDADGILRFNADFANVSDLKVRIDALLEEYGYELESARSSLLSLYERVFKHRAFTGRSGGMFGFEGLGCIYWHMVSKLLLAVQENFLGAEGRGADEATERRLGDLYYKVRDGIGFNKSPSEFGAFPLDPYSHSPAHAGARQPGMTGQVKEEILTRFGELGLSVADGRATFDPKLLRRREFLQTAGQFRFVDIHGQWQTLELPGGSLAFTWCQVPILYRLDDDANPQLVVHTGKTTEERYPQQRLPAETSAELFRRSGRIRQLSLTFNTGQLFGD